MLPNRDIKIQAEQPHQLFTFYPHLSGGNGEILLRKRQSVTSGANGLASISLKIGRWTCVPPSDFDDEQDIFVFDLVEGDEITLDELLLAGLPTEENSPVYRYIEEKIEAGLGDITGADGKSAYDVAVDNGFSGSESQWLLTLRGPQGPAGVNGTNGTNGTNGSPGATGPKGDKGDTGNTGPTGATGNTGATGPQGPAGPQGPPGEDGSGASDIDDIPDLRDTLDELREDLDAFDLLPAPTFSTELVDFDDELPETPSDGNAQTYLQNLSGYATDKILTIVAGVMAWIYAFCFAINVKDYGASGSPLTTNGSINAGQNTLTIETGEAGNKFLASCKVGHGIFVEGAGNEGSGNDLVRRITAINGRVLTLAANATATVSGALVHHDDTEAIQAAIIAGYYKSGEIPGTHQPSGFGRNVFLYAGFWGDEGCYWVNKKWISSHNGILILPDIPETENSRNFKMVADYRISPHWVDNTTKVRGGSSLRTKLKGTGTYPAIIAAKPFENALGEDYQQRFSHISCHLQDIAFQLPSDSNTIAANFGNALNASIENCFVHADIHQSNLTPATTHGGGFVMPQTNNTALCRIKDTVVVGGKMGYFIGEHTQLEYAFGAFCNDLFHIQESHRPIEGKIGGEHCQTYIRFLGQASVRLTANIEFFPGNSGFASPPYAHIIDAENFAYGTIDINWTEGNVGLTTRQASVTGCGNLKFSSTTQAFTPDDGSASNSLVERNLPSGLVVTPGASIADDFTKPMSLDNRLPDKANNGSRWKVTGAPIAVTGNKARHIGGVAIALIDAAKANNRIYWNRGYSEGFAPILRAEDEENFLGITMNNTTGKVELYKFVNDDYELIDSHTVAGMTSAEADGTNIKVYNGVSLVHTFEGITDFLTETDIGFRSSGYTILYDYQAV